MTPRRILSFVLILALASSVVLPVLAATLSVSTVAADSEDGATSIAVLGGQKLIVDTYGKHLAVYVDSSGRLAVTVANGDPRQAGAWSPPVKSPVPSSSYARPAAVLATPTSLRIIAEGGTGSHYLVDVPVTLTRDSGGNIGTISYGTTKTIDSSGSAFYPSAILAHDGSIILVWNAEQSASSKVNGLRWIPSSGWKSLIDTSSTTPTTLISDTSNKSPIFPSVIQRPDNRKLYVLGNRGSGSSNLVFSSATFNGQSWNTGNQNLSYETNAARGVEDATSVVWDRTRSVVVAAYDISGTNKYGVFTIDSSDKKTHIDTPSLSVSDNDGGGISVDVATGNYYLFILDANTDGSSGRIVYITRTSGSWSTTLNLVDGGTSKDIDALSVQRATTPEPSILYSKGKSVPKTIKFATLSSGPPPPPPLSVSFSYSPQTPSSGDSVSFTATASAGTQPYSFSWSFGDGASSTGNPVSHAYSAGGSYNVALTVTDSVGQKATASQTVTVTSQNSSIFSPTDDAYVQQNTPSTNYGTSTEIDVDNSPVKNILLKFNVQVTGTISAATLRLFQVDASDLGGDFHTAPSNWTETSVTWDNAPAANPTVFFSLESVSSNTWYEVDMTQVVTGNGLVSLRITSTSSDGSHFSSKEGQHPSQLIVSVASSSNPPPTITAPSSRTGNEQSLVSFTVSATDDPSQTITITAPGLPSGALFTSTPAPGSTSGSFSWTPSEAQGPGVYVVTFRATDSLGASSQSSVTITVNEVNTSPVVSAPSSQTVAANTTLTFTVTGTDSDLPANTLTLSATGLGSGMSFASTPGNPASGTFTFAPGPGQAGQSFTVTFTATDNGNPVLSGSKTTTTTVTSSGTSTDLYAVVSSSDGNVFRYYENGTFILAGRPVTSVLRQVAWKPDGSYALIVGESAVLLKYDGSQLTTIPTGVSSSDGFYTVAWKPDGSYALIGGDGGLVLKYDGFSITTVQDSASAPIRSITWNPSGTQALLAGHGGTMLLYQASTGQLQSLTSGTTQNFYAAAWNPSGQYALAGGTNGILVKYDGIQVATLDTTGVYNTALIVRYIAWNPTGTLALLVGDSGLTLTYDGSALASLPTSTGNGLYGISWLDSTATIVGNSGTVLTCSNGVLTKQTVNVTPSLRGISWKPS